MLYGWCRSSWTRRCCGILHPPWHFHGLILVDDARLDSWFILYCDRLIRNEKIEDWIKPVEGFHCILLSTSVFLLLFRSTKIGLVVVRCNRVSCCILSRNNIADVSNQLYRKYNIIVKAGRAEIRNEIRSQLI